MDMFMFIVSIFMILGAVFGFSSKKVKNTIPAGLLVVALVFIGFACTTIIKPRTVGIVVSFGKPVDSLSNGVHLKAPWASVEKLDGAVQNDVYNGAEGIKVRLGNKAEAMSDASIQWQLRSDDAMGVFLDYRTFENIQQNLVDRNFRASMNEVMTDYDPLDMTDGTEGGTDLKTLSEDVRNLMEEKVGDQIDIKSVTIPIINFDQPTQERINELQSETARTRIAKQKQETAKAEAEANRQLESSLSEEVLVSKCLDIIAESGHSPIGCFPGTNVQPYMQVGEETSTPTPATTEG